MNDSLGDRMKEYERCYKIMLPKKHSVIIRLDGRAFHTFTRGLNKPFDGKFVGVMMEVAKYLFENVQNCKCAYVQSDEISLLLEDTDRIETDSWFGNSLQKIVSISASMATAKFNQLWGSESMALFDSRAFLIPHEDVANYFVWRQRDWNRNSLNMLSSSHFSHKELQGKNSSEKHEMLFGKNINWANLDNELKNGTLFYLYNACLEKFDYAMFNKMIFCESEKE